MIIGTHYYRPPFPMSKHWEKDMDAIKDAGVELVQLWVTWAWVEAEPGIYQFDDYDALINEAGKRGLKVGLSIVAELQPEWIHRLEPEAAMVDHMGRQVISSHRIESNQGLTPGCCTDHEPVQNRMALFLQAVAGKYGKDPRILWLDAWNELRWNIHCDGYVCYCRETLREFRNWLDRRYGGLEGLRSAWHRRIVSWEDVHPPKAAGRPYTENMAFQQFLQRRAEEHLRWRVGILREAGVERPVFAHGATSSIDQAGSKAVFQQAVCRGNDWVHAKSVEGYGVSHFPAWGGMDGLTFLLGVEASAAAAEGRELWLSELQGGAANYGQEPGIPVSAAMLESWLWMGISAGARGVVFWSWSDEVFGREATGFGLAGKDGLADERMRSLRELRKILDAHAEELKSYHQQKARVGVFFDLDNHNLEASESGEAVLSRDGLRGWLRACSLAGEKAVVLERGETQKLEDLSLLIMPGAFVIDAEAGRRIIDWVKAGGTLVVEGDADAWSAEGFYRADAADREFLSELGVVFAGRRRLGSERLSVQVGNTSTVLPCGWQKIAIREDGAERESTVRRIGKGQVLALGGFAGIGYEECRRQGEDTLQRSMESLVAALSGSKPEDVHVEGGRGLVVRRGTLGRGRRVVFLFNQDGGAEALVTMDFPVEDWAGAESFPKGTAIPVGIGRLRVLAEECG